jgi:hypothetical protein
MIEGCGIKLAQDRSKWLSKTRAFVFRKIRETFRLAERPSASQEAACYWYSLPRAVLYEV